MRRLAPRNSLWLLLFAAIFILQASIQIHAPRDGAPLIGDSAEVHNIGWNLAHGRGYSVNWDDPKWREAYLAHSKPSILLDMILTRSGSHPTMSRPPLMPLLVAGVIKLYPSHPFLGWRLVDALLFSLGTCLLAAATRSVFGDVAMILVIATTLLDPLRSSVVPGWWTEGMAFDAMAAIVWLLARRPQAMSYRLACVGGVVLGLLCLDRSFFIILLPPLALLLGDSMAGKNPSIISRLRVSVLVLLVAMLVQVPWWLRNIQISHQMLPLGTQGGFNFPDEYSDHAIAIRGGWDGDGMGWAWSTRPEATADEVAGRFPPVVAGMRPAHPRSGDAVYATMCGTLASEIAVCNVGMRSGMTWLKAHPLELPHLFLLKIGTQIRYDGIWMSFLSLASTIAILFSRHRRFVITMAMLVVVYAIGIGLTHAMPGRFLVPILPPLYVAAAEGIAALLALFIPTYSMAPKALG